MLKEISHNWHKEIQTKTFSCFVSHFLGKDYWWFLSWHDDQINQLRVGHREQLDEGEQIEM